MIKFTRQSVRPDGEALYRLEKDGEVLRENITLDEVVRAINRMDEERAGIDRRGDGAVVGGRPQGSPLRGGDDHLAVDRDPEERR